MSDKKDKTSRSSRDGRKSKEGIRPNSREQRQSSETGTENKNRKSFQEFFKFKKRSGQGTNSSQDQQTLQSIQSQREQGSNSSLLESYPESPQVTPSRTPSQNSQFSRSLRGFPSWSNQSSPVQALQLKKNFDEQQKVLRETKTPPPFAVQEPNVEKGPPIANKEPNVEKEPPLTKQQPSAENGPPFTKQQPSAENGPSLTKQQPSAEKGPPFTKQQPSAEKEPSTPVQAQDSNNRTQTQLSSELYNTPLRTEIQQDLLDIVFEKNGIYVSENKVPILEQLSKNVVQGEANSSKFSVVGLKNNTNTSQFDTLIGELKCSNFLACARNKLWWMTPEFGTKGIQIPPETQFLLLELKEGGPYCVILPLISVKGFRSTLRSASKLDGYSNSMDNQIAIRIESGDQKVVEQFWDDAFLVAAGSNPYTLVEFGVTGAAKLSGGAKPLIQKKIPPFVDYLGWCTWDAFYSRVNAKGIIHKLSQFKENGIKLGYLIIDDGWQRTDLDREIRKIPLGNIAEDLIETALIYIESFFFVGVQKISLKDKVEEIAHHTQQDFKMVQDQVHDQRQPHGGNPQQAQEIKIAQADQYYKKLQEGGPIQKARLLTQQQIPFRFFIQFLLISTIASFKVFYGVVTAIVKLITLKVFQYSVESADYASLPTTMFMHAARGQLKDLFLEHYADTGDALRRLSSVTANGKFNNIESHGDVPWENPSNLDMIVKYIKKEFAIKYVFVWHSITGYWSGVGTPQKTANTQELIELESTIIMPEPTPGVREVEPSMAWQPLVLSGVGVVKDPQTLYSNMHSYLQSQGIDGVKVDCQASAGMCGWNQGGGPALSARFHQALETSVARHFPNNQCINCMSHSTENLYRHKESAIARVSDDFYPRDPASYRPHIAICAYNTIFMGVLTIPDWDMFQSHHEYRLMHGMARAISGGPIYVSDKVDQHDIELLKRLVLRNGQILRAQKPGRPTRDCLFKDVLRDGKSILKVWNMNKCNGIVAAFHLQGSQWSRQQRKFVIHDSRPKALETQFKFSDIEDILNTVTSQKFFSGKFLIFDNEDGSYQTTETKTISLSAAEAKFFTVCPIYTIGDCEVAPVGLVPQMINGGAAIQGISFDKKKDGSNQMNLKILGDGNLKIYVTKQPRSVCMYNKDLEIQMQDSMASVTIPDMGTFQDIEETILVHINF